MHKTILLVIVGISITVIAGCASETKKAEQKSADTVMTLTPPTNAAMSSTFGHVAGVSWSIPANWSIGPENPMRVATYVVKAADGDTNNAECGVFYFPTSDAGQGGGSVQGNIDRWIGQMEQPDGSPSTKMAKTGNMTANGLNIVTVELSGTYRLTAGPMMQLKAKKPGWYMIGAIVEGPSGPVFFKMVGPEKTMAAAKNNFLGMLGTAKKETI